MAWHHQHGVFFCATIAISTLALLLALFVGSTTASPRFVEGSPPGSGELARPALQQREGLQQDPTSRVRGTAPYTRNRNAPHDLPEALQRFTFNARSGGRAPSKDHLLAGNPEWKAGNFANEQSSHFDAHADSRELADTALVVTVDGTIHAINRESGTWLWSLHDEDAQNQRQQVIQHPLVRSNVRNASAAAVSRNQETLVPGLESAAADTPNGFAQRAHVHSAESDSAEDDEIYIIEPHSAGDIYVYHKSTGRMQRLPLSVTQLVELSPFTFPVPSGGQASTDNKLFVGRKESKLVGVDLRSGKLVGLFGPEAGWCEWPQEPTGGSNGRKAALHAAEEAIENRPQDLLYLGQTDYHISIFSKNQGLLQTLSYTSYGPSGLVTSPASADAEHQHSLDGRYIQPMHDGSLVCLKEDNEGIQWTNRFSHPVVAVFDLWFPAPDTADSGVGQPMISVHPHHRVHTHLDEIAHFSPSTFVGILDSHSVEAGVGPEYYAMSSDHFPLVSFAPANQGVASQAGTIVPSSLIGSHRIDEPMESGRTIDAPSRPLAIDPVPSNESSLPPAPDRGTISGNTTSQFYPKSLANLLTIGTFEPSVAVLQSIFLVFGVFVIAFGYLRRRSPSKSRHEREMRTDVEMRTNRSHPSLIPSEDGSNVAPDTWNGLDKLGKHASSRSLDKELPALPIEESVQAKLPSPEDTPSDEEDATDGEGDNKLRNPKKGRRRRRGGKRGRGIKANGSVGALAQAVDECPVVLGAADSQQELAIVKETAPQIIGTDQDGLGRVGALAVSESVLGYGSHGTVVLKGTFQGRAVAVKRLLKDFVTVASHEVALLQESDDHPNVIRYFCKESRESFHYIALELCPTSLFELVDNPASFPTLISNFDPLKALRQITKGMAHLHKLKIIHRDMKPQNILIAVSPSKRPDDSPVIRMVISDFGLCKKLDLDESSFLQSTRGGGNHAPGSFGYRAPEVLRGDVDANEVLGGGTLPSTIDGSDSLLSSRSASSGSNATLAVGSSRGTGSSKKLTRAIDIFSLGCIFYFVLTMGEHPFGSRYEREINILNDKLYLDGLDVMTEGKEEARALIRSMCHTDPVQRPTANEVLTHPLFWTSSQSLHFLCDASDRFEIMDRDNGAVLTLESSAPDIVGKDWLKNGLDRNLIENLGKYRKYDGGSVRDLLRVLRNKKHHYQDLPENVRRSLGEPPAGFLAYFSKRFPKLLLHVHTIVRQYVSDEKMFSAYFEQEDS